MLSFLLLWRGGAHAGGLIMPPRFTLAFLVYVNPLG
jgi:hypothetical protein